MGQMIDEEECEVCIPFDQEWIFTYGDLVTLLFCFFVLLFSMCVYETEKFKSVADSFKPLPAGTPFISEGRDSVVEDISKKWRKASLGMMPMLMLKTREWSYPSGQAPSLRQIQLI